MLPIQLFKDCTHFSILPFIQSVFFWIKKISINQGDFYSPEVTIILQKKGEGRKRGAGEIGYQKLSYNNVLWVTQATRRGVVSIEKILSLSFPSPPCLSQQLFQAYGHSFQVQHQ